ncbi:MAG: HAD hydrolase family protein [Lachnospiraceae bacterium]
MRNKKQWKPPAIGLRIIKSAVAVTTIVLAYKMLSIERTPFYAAIAAILCMQPYREDTAVAAKNRILGTLLGAAAGILVMLAELHFADLLGNAIPLALLIGLCCLGLLYITVLLGQSQTAYFSCVVFLSIAVAHRGENSAFSFALYRVIDTTLGILLAFLLNSLQFPRRYNNETLFISGLDDTLLDSADQMSAYSRVELNRMLKSGARFTISTERTPAGMLEATRCLELSLPVITMDGSALFDIQKNRYILEYIIPKSAADAILEHLNQLEVLSFKNVILDDVLLIYHSDLTQAWQRAHFENLKKSPYRNFMHKGVPKEHNIVYFSIYEKKEILEELREYFERQEYSHHIRCRIQENVYGEYAVLRIHSKNATKENMSHHLMQQLHMKSCITFGTRPGQYDILVNEGNMDQVVKTLKKLYEPLALPWRKQSHKKI